MNCYHCKSEIIIDVEHPELITLAETRHSYYELYVAYTQGFTEEMAYKESVHLCVSCRAQGLALPILQNERRGYERSELDEIKRRGYLELNLSYD